MDSDKIIVSGGWCTPVQPIYDLPLQPIYDLPTFRANRGPIDYKTPSWDTKSTRFLSMAMGVATTSKCNKKHGAVVVKHGHVLGSSPNLWKNDPKNVDHKFSSVHAEIAALRKAGWPTKVTVYVARANGLGEARLSKPCANCQIVLDEQKCKVVYTV